MALQSSGPISMSDIRTEFEGSASSGARSISDYYRAGPIVPNHSGTSTIPTSGTISFSNFYGTQYSNPSSDGE